ncbi:unnamed protein product, partial [marine sediment metagenome]
LRFLTDDIMTVIRTGYGKLVSGSWNKRHH